MMRLFIFCEVLGVCAMTLVALECNAEGLGAKQCGSLIAVLSKLPIMVGATADTNDYRLLAERIEQCERKLAQAEGTLLRDMLSLFAVIVAVVGIISYLWIRIVAKGIRNTVETQVSEGVKKLEEVKSRYQQAVTAVKGEVFTTMQISVVLLDIGKNILQGMSVHGKFGLAMDHMLLKVELARARLAVKLGTDDEVISGANFLSQRGVLGTDESLMRNALKREGLSDEARETLERAISDLEKRPKQKSA